MNREVRLSKEFDTFIFDWDGTLMTVKILMLLNERLNPLIKYYKWKGKASAIKKVKLPVPKHRRDYLHMEEEAAEDRLLSGAVNLLLSMMKPRLHNGAKETLEELDRQNKKIALFTNGSAVRVIKEMKKLHIEKYFDAIESAQQLGAWKPNPLGLQVLMKTLNSRKERTIYIGDMASDIETARYAGVASCAISRGFDSKYHIERYNPDYMFSSMEELYKAIKEPNR
ncbi:MAG: HAD family hydrolase [Candidatus Marsarchaeota archaeon]|nr:HAD family hydrolase [Candidatus Marsarchaeota archaeon]MCL5114982.1 HAD family hydrolase [Candidatus Marsarchaeota archaeon]